MPLRGWEVCEARRPARDRAAAAQCAVRCRLAELDGLANSTGQLASKERWFAVFDSVDALERTRGCLQFLVDLALSVQRLPVYRARAVAFEDSLGGRVRERGPIPPGGRAPPPGLSFV